MILRGDRIQWGRYATVANTNNQHCYMHPGNPHDDSLGTMGEAAYNHIILKEIQFGGQDSDVRFNRITLHYSGGGQEVLAFQQVGDIVPRGVYSLTRIPCRTEVDGLVAIDVDVDNVNGDTARQVVIVIVFELVK